MSTTANKEIVRRFYEEVFNQRNIDAIDELVHPEFLNHDPTPVASRDPESMKQFIHTITQAFPDHHHAIFQRKGFANEDLIAEGDQVVMRCTLTATHQGLFPGFLDMPPLASQFVSDRFTFYKSRMARYPSIGSSETI
jgi:predicted SnoaL-like aldol condensation-catalyzing enzyme